MSSTLPASAAVAAPLTTLRVGLLRQGYHPVPVSDPNPMLSNGGKAPFMRGWQQKCALADEAEVAGWTTGVRNHGNTGLLCGELAGLDLDVPVPELAEQLERLADAMLGITPLHRIGRAPKTLRCYRAAVPLSKMETPELLLPDGTKLQVEVLGAGQQFVAYGIHPGTGQPYTWPQEAPDALPLSALPVVAEPALRAFLTAAEAALRAAGGLTEKERAKATASAAPDNTTAPGIVKPKVNRPKGAGGNEFFVAVNRAALDNIGAWFPAIFPTAEQQDGTGAWRVSSADLGRGLEEDLSMHPSEGGQDFGTRQSCSPIDVTMQWSSAPTAQDAAFWLCEKLGKAPATMGWKEPKAKAPERPPTAAELDGFLLNEDGVALAFRKRFKEQLRYCHHAQHWYVWTGTHWRREESKLAFSWARQVCRNVAKDLPPDDKVKHILARASTASAVERFAQSDRAFAVTADTWDRDGWLLGTPGGTVDLRTGELRPALLTDHITKLAAVAPAPAGTPHPAWTKFLHEATGNDADLVAFLQRFAGYCLTGDVSEEMLAFLYGDGGTGKGTFIGTIVAVMADYAVSVPIEVFTAGSRLNLEYYRARMAGTRLVTASETEAGATWAESLLKELTGNEAPLSARHAYGKVFEYKPQFKIGLVGNHAPRLKGRSKAMERRLRITPFKHKPAKVDLKLKDRLKGEAPAILRWMVEGCRKWQQDGLGTCKAIEAETGAYFEQQDSFSRWMSERCVLASAMAPVSEKPSRLLMDFLAWARNSGELAVTSGEFREMIERQAGLKYAMNKGVRWVRGIGLKPHEGQQGYSAGGD